MARFLFKDLIGDVLSQCIYQKRLFWISVGMLYLIVTQLTIVICKDAKSVSSSLDLQCPPCAQVFCMPRNPKRLKCKGGVTTGVCNCCPVCAKIEGETCGGAHGYLGKCDIGLKCTVESSDNEVLKTDYSNEKLAVSTSNAEGTCKKDKTFRPPFTSEMIGDAPFVNDKGKMAFCEPRCTAQYCEKNPRAICSAIDNSDSINECQGDCQHTSCRACRYVFDSHHCGKCNKGDFKCIKKFGQCMRKNTCTRKSFPCKKSKTKNPLLNQASFKCTIPGCI